MAIPQQFSEEKFAAIEILEDSGVPLKKAIALTGYSQSSIPAVQTHFNRYRLTSKKLLKKGKAAVEKVLDDFIGDKDNVRAADALRVVEMQQARIDPAIQKIEQDTRTVSMELSGSQVERLLKLREKG